MYTLRLPLKTSCNTEAVLEKRFGLMEKIHNQVVKHAKTLLTKLYKDKEYKLLKTDYFTWKQKAEAGDKADILGDNVSSDDKNTLYKDTMKFFEQLYGETSMDETTENTDAAVPDNTDASYDTEGTDTSMDNTDDTTMDESDMTPAEGDDMVYDETINE